MIRQRSTIISILLFFSFNLFFSTRPVSIPFAQIKGLYTEINPDYKKLSPVNGFTWWKTGLVENMYRYGNQSDDTIKLIKALFYLQPWDNITFDITTLNSKPAKYFTASTIGTILAHLYSYAKGNKLLTTKDEEKLFQVLKNSIKQDLKYDNFIKQAAIRVGDITKPLIDTENLTQQKKKKEKEFKSKDHDFKQTERALKQLNLDHEKEKDTRKIQKIEKSIEIQQKKLTGLKIETETLKKELEAITKKIEEGTPTWKEYEQKIARESLTEKSLEQLITLIINSLKESLGPNQKYPPFTTVQILLAFLWQKVSDKNDYLLYFRQFLPKIPIVDKELMSNDQKADTFAQANYTQDEFNTFQNTIEKTSELEKFVLDNYELALFSAYADTIWNQSLPKILPSISDATFKPDNKTEYKFPDCGETALRNFFNIVLYEKENPQFDITFLGNLKTKLPISQELITFYKKFPFVGNAESQECYNNWTYVVSNLGGVDYRIKNICNIAGTHGISNIVKVFNHLLFGNDPSFDQLSNSEKLDLVCKNLSHDNFILTWEVKDNEKDVVNKQNVNIVLQFTINDTYKFDWEFYLRHFVIPSALKGSNKLKYKIFSKLSNGLLSKKINQNTFNIFNLLLWNTSFTSWIYDESLITDKKLTLGLATEFPLYFTLLYFVQDIKNNLRFLDLLDFYKGVGVPEKKLDDYIPKNLMLSMTEHIKKILYHDPDIDIEFSRVVIEYPGIFQFYDLIKELLEKTKNPNAKNKIIYKILEYEIDSPLYKNVVDTFKNATQPQDILMLATLIIRNKIYEQPKALKFNLKKIVTQKVNFSIKVLGTLLEKTHDPEEQKKLQELLNHFQILSKQIE